MKRLLFNCLLLMLTACSGWTVRPLPYTPATPFSSSTPSIYTPTPIILPPPITPTLASATLTPTLLVSTVTPGIEPTFTEIPPSHTITPTTTETAALVKIQVDLLGCNTGLDLSHGMGEVTNAYMTIKNLGSADLENVCATLNGKDEGRPHPDKTKCLPTLSAGYQVTQKLTVDTTFKEDTPIQIDVTSNAILLERVGKDFCKDIGLFPPDENSLGMVNPIP